ncbi:alpha/beta-hydrolase [Athelia psychrophila]|uniref:Alpha/beta-hydrolase n=1 Tax=Athelia psychrophila TaxID=1759441 RepID=A0A166MYU8_9AGAM|nr:alpha/beta-hydrolase [Fibularhizoctonia sp. CBS 109695]
MRFSAAIVPLALSVLGAVASPMHVNKKRTIDDDVYADLVYYFQYAASAYSNSCANPNGNTLVTEFTNGDTYTQGFIARDDTRKEIVVSLRGSSSAGDFLTDAELLLEDFTSPGVTPPSGVSAHSGFLDAWNSVAPDVISSVTSELASNPGYAIVTSGHSLGGSLSSLAAISLQGNFPSQTVRMYTYGQPRTGNDAYAAWVNDKFGDNAFRSTHTNDGVPTIIPTSLGYKHHGVEYWQNPDPATAANTVKCDADGEDPACSASIPSAGIDIAHTIYYGILAITPFCST